ncbi:helix-turn-helix domain-containing protein [Rhodococcus baikonurensis]|uniref:AraC-like ligand-binding domain-containing protein n=1 Tax=Rhodococcus erythropolis group TaxID=2840174 RepID=UPI000BB33BCC|nr:helix-turn-helix domain-containing protein [Rhodococcus erythropolis]PBI86874.1 Transcriptional activator NphR [Rhodococcus erythropolis]
MSTPASPGNPLESVREQLDGWQNALSGTFFPLQVGTQVDHDFRCGVDTHHIGELQLSVVHARPETVVRTGKQARSDESEHYCIAFQRVGIATFTQDGRTTVLRPGQFTVYDSTREFAFSFDSPHTTAVSMFARSALDLDASQIARVTATAVSSNEGLGKLVSSLLLNLVDSPDEFSDVVSRKVSSTLLDLVETLYRETLLDSSDSESAQRSFLIRVKTFIEDNLRECHLSVSDIAEAHFVSVRYMHKAFENEKLGVAQYVRHRRLERIRQQLVDPLMARRPVGEIAAMHGVINEAHFSRIFREKYGASPSEYRRQYISI